MKICVAALVRGAPLAAAAGAATVVCFRETSALRHPAEPAFDDLLVAAAAWIMVLAAGWAAVVLTAGVLEVASSGRLALTAHLGCRGPVRRGLLSTLGLALACGGALVTSPVSAAPAPFGDASPRVRAAHGLTLPSPARPTGSAHHGLRHRIEVRPGDSLWRLSRQRAPAAPAAEVAGLVRRTYLANRRVIGPDPDLIRPGQRLLLPRRHPHAPTHAHLETR